MVESWTFGSRLMAGFAVTVCAFVAVVVIGQRATRGLIDSTSWVTHTHEVRTELATLMADLVDAETSQRGYALTGSERFLQPYRKAVVALDQTFERIRTLTGDNQRQQARLLAIRPVLDERVTEFVSVLDARSSGGLEAAAARVASAHGQELTDRVRRLLAEMDNEEQSLLVSRVQSAAEATELAHLISVWGGAATVLFTVIIALLLSRTLARRVGTAAAQVEISSTELQTASNQQVSSAREQATAMTEISTTMTELLATSRQISESAMRVSQIAAQTGTSARSGEALVEQGNDAAAMVRRQVDVIVSHMLDLGKKSQQANQVVDIVSELAEQTNILAINAAIEASGAGDAGARFGVVADEIRKLADRVSTSTKAIRQTLDDVRSAVTATVMATETGSKAIDRGARQVEDMAESFRQIAPLVSSTVDAAREIELSTKQQSTAVEQVNIAISDAAQATRETESASTQVLQTARQLTTMAGGLSRLVQRAS